MKIFTKIMTVIGIIISSITILCISIFILLAFLSAPHPEVSDFEDAFRKYSFDNEAMMEPPHC